MNVWFRVLNTNVLNIDHLLHRDWTIGGLVSQSHMHPLHHSFSSLLFISLLHLLSFIIFSFILFFSWCMAIEPFGFASHLLFGLKWLESIHSFSFFVFRFFLLFRPLNVWVERRAHNEQYQTHMMVDYTYECHRIHISFDSCDRTDSKTMIIHFRVIFAHMKCGLKAMRRIKY